MAGPWADDRELVQSLLALAESLAAPNPLADRMTAVCRATATMLGCDRCSIFLRDADRYRARFNHGNPPDIAAQFPRFSVRLDDPVISEAMRTKSFALYNDARSHPVLARTANAARIDAIVFAPFFDPSGEPSGFLTAEYNERALKFDDTMSTIVLSVAKLIELVMETESERRARALADTTRDSLLRDLEAVDLQRITLLAQLVEAEQAERQRISLDLHDGPLQGLIAGTLRLELLARRTADSDAVEGILRDLHGTVDALRSFSFHLHPASLVGMPIGTALVSVAQELSGDAWKIHSRDDVGAPLGATSQLTLLRVAREALQNVRKHAGAVHVRVEVEPAGGGVLLRISDDGCGIGPQGWADSSTGHLGLLGMSERAEAAGGWLRVGGKPGVGTVVEAWLPDRSA